MPRGVPPRAQCAEYDPTRSVCASTVLRSVGSFKSVVSRGASDSNPKMDDGGPTLQAMVTRGMKQIGDAYGGGGGSRLDRGEQWMVIHNRIGQEDFIDVSPAQVQRRGIVESAPRSHPCEEPIILAIPEP